MPLLNQPRSPLWRDTDAQAYCDMYLVMTSLASSGTWKLSLSSEMSLDNVAYVWHLPTMSNNASLLLLSRLSHFIAFFPFNFAQVAPPFLFIIRASCVSRVLNTLIRIRGFSCDDLPCLGSIFIAIHLASLQKLSLSGSPQEYAHTV